MREVSLSEVKDHLTEYLRLAEEQEIIITRRGKPIGVLIGFATEEDWFDYQLEHDERFLGRIAKARQSLRDGRGTRLEELVLDDTPPEMSLPKEATFFQWLEYQVDRDDQIGGFANNIRHTSLEKDNLLPINSVNFDDWLSYLKTVLYAPDIVTTFQEAWAEYEQFTRQ